MLRKDEILLAVDTLIRVHDEWEADLQAPDVPTDRFEHAIEGAIGVCDVGDTPEVCHELVTAIARLGLEWEDYKGGKMTPQHKPVGRFWAAFRAVVDAREGAMPFIPKRPEPVAELLRQNVTHRQIALHIYGDGKTGPFVDRSGQPDIRLIQQEAAQPGSVIPVDWMHPCELERSRKHQAESTARLQSITSRENDGEVVDPASIEELLREGQYPNAIARAKRCTVEEVIAVMHRLQAEGVPVNGTLPNLAAMRAPGERQLTKEQDAGLQPRRQPPLSQSPLAGTLVDTDIDDSEDDTDIVQGDAVAAGSTGSSSTSDPAAVEALIVELHQQRPELGAGELVAEIKEQLGESVSVQKVSGILRRAKAEAAQAATV